MLHAERSICDPTGTVVGSIVVHVMLDYRNLLFISSQSPYFELFRPTELRAPGEGTPGSDVDVAIYGWGLHPLYTSGRTAWSIDDALFQRIYDKSRAPFWASIARSDGDFQVYFSNDRFFIYAIGYPSLIAVRPSRPSGRADHIRRRRVRAGSDWHRSLHASQPAPRPRRPGSPSGDPRQLLPEAVLCIRAGRRGPGPDAGLRDTCVFRGSPARCGAGGSGAHRRRGTARHSAIRRARASQQRRDHAGQRRRAGVDQPGDRAGHQHLRRCGAARDERARSLLVRIPPYAHARRGLPRHRARSPARVSSTRIRLGPFRTSSPRRRSGPARAIAS